MSVPSPTKGFRYRCAYCGLSFSFENHYRFKSLHFCDAECCHKYEVDELKKPIEEAYKKVGKES